MLSGHDLVALGLAPSPPLGEALGWLLGENRAGRLLEPTDAARAVQERWAPRR